ncbi:hypothetical protein COXBURSA331_A0089 [Coxiella burnetii RSA 331]|nr:hypothetical protein COXBURSA331_A0089 [Coxiella burnetii RSA 331]EDR36685.1 hypothetical protein COXBURSA334_2161 [Coxiella burnetii Q321]
MQYSDNERVARMQRSEIRELCSFFSASQLPGNRVFWMG